MRFEWRDEDFGLHEATLYDDNNKKIESIYFWDYSCKYSIDEAIRNKWFRRYAFEVGYCNGFSMNRGFDETEDNGKYGYNGTPKHTVDDIKRWCENWIATLYINGYESTIKRLDDMKSKAEWFINNGYEKINED